MIPKSRAYELIAATLGKKTESCRKFLGLVFFSLSGLLPQCGGGESHAPCARRRTLSASAPSAPDRASAWRGGSTPSRGGSTPSRGVMRRNVMSLGIISCHVTMTNHEMPNQIMKYHVKPTSCQPWFSPWGNRLPPQL